MIDLREDLIKLGTTHPKLRPHIRPLIRGKRASSDLREELIKLGTTNPELRPHIRPLLEKAATEMGTPASILLHARNLVANHNNEDGIVAYYQLLRACQMFAVRELRELTVAKHIDMAADFLNNLNEGMLANPSSGAPLK